MPKERQTCTECSMRRQKCDRNIPCARCVKRGDADKCTREWPKEGYDPKIHRIYPRPSEKGGNNTSPTSTSQPSPANSSTAPPETVDPSLQTLRTPASSTTGHLFEPTASKTRRSSSNIIASGVQTETGAPDGADVNPRTEFDMVGWGRAALTDYHISNKVQLGKETKPQDMDWDWDYSNGFGTTAAAQIQFLQLLLPSRQQISQLVDYHLNSILWYHASFHGPTFLKELTELFNRPNELQVGETDLRWMAVLFAVMAASMTCANDQQAQSWGFKKVERSKLTRNWFKAALCCLNLDDYMWRHHIFSVQAIEVLTMSAHILGFSNTQSTLLGAALKIAQGLGLQRMTQEEDYTYDPNMDAEARAKIIRREMGRRMWTQLCVQDWFSIPFSEMYTIQRNQFSTPMPEYLNDETLEPVSSDVPTIVSFNRCMVDLARIFSQCHDAVTESNTLLTKYDEVIKFEQKIKEKNSQLPAVMDIKKPLDPSWPVWITWARRSLTVCYAHKIIMVHRHFLGRSFTEATFARTREACMTAAKTILREAKNAYESDGPVLWIDQAFMVAAGITLSLDLFHRQDNDPLFEEHRNYVEAAITILRKFDSSMIAIRGIRLLSQLLTEQARVAANQKMDVYKLNHPGKRPRGSIEQAGSNVTSPLYPDPIKRPRKFDVGGFVQSLGTNNDFVNSLNPPPGFPRTPGLPNFFDQTPMINGQTPMGGNQLMPNGYFSSVPTTGAGSGFTPAPTSGVPQVTGAPNYNLIANNTLPRGASDQFQQFQNLDLGYETFEQLFPPQTGISNNFLFEDLLNFDLQHDG